MYSSSDGTDNNNRKNHRKGDKSKEQQQQEQEILRQLSSLQLPHMEYPSHNHEHASSSSSEYPNLFPQDVASNNINMQQHNNEQEEQQLENPPTIRILVVSDIDLVSASALAESALTNEELQYVDLCIAIGPFCSEEDLKPYLKGRQRRRHMARYHGHHHHHHTSTNTNSSSVSSPYSRMTMIPPMPQHNCYDTRAAPGPSPSSSPYTASTASNSYSKNNNILSPFQRTKEETAALEGLMTAALSQLESIVCRVIFVPGKTDPMTTICSASNSPSASPDKNCSSTNNNDDDQYNTKISYTKERRLTPNSRNIHQHWMPLCPGLGCAGLLYMDWQKLQQKYPPPLEDDDDHDDDDDDDDVDSEDEDSEVPEDSSFSYHHQDDGDTGVTEGEANNTNNNTGHNHLLHQSSSASLNSPTLPHLTPHTPFSPSCNNAENDDESSNHNRKETLLLTEAERAEQYGTEFVDHLEKLVKSAPPTSAVTELPSQTPSSSSSSSGSLLQQQSHSSIAGLLKTSLFQSILVTQYHHLENDCTSYDDYDDGSNLNNNTSGIITFPQQQQQQSGTTEPNTTTVTPTNDRGPHPPLYGPNHDASAAAAATSNTDTATLQDDPLLAPTSSSSPVVDNPPWPSDQHDTFCSLPVVQEHVILEISAGKDPNGTTLPPKEFRKGNIQIVLPGSLRERGEFCLVDVAFMKSGGGITGVGPGPPTTAPAARNHGGTHNHHVHKNSNTGNDDYRWRVRRTRFHAIGDYV